MSQFNPERLFRTFPPAYVARGRDYFDRNRVEFVNVRKDGSLTAIVKGSGRRHYQLSVEPITLHNNQWQVEGSCSCPVHHNCKHVVAALLAAERKGFSLLGGSGEVDVVPMAERSGQGSGEDFVEEWVEALSVLAEESAKQKTGQQKRRKKQKHQLLYLLISPQPGQPLKLEIRSAYKKKDGSYSQIKLFSPVTTLQGMGPDLVQEEDERLFRNLYLHSKGDFSHGRCELAGEESADLMLQLAQTGRCHWDSSEGAVLRFSEPGKADLVWVENQQGEQKLTAAVVGRENATILQLDRPLYWLQESGEVGELQSEYPVSLLQRLEQLPPIPVQQVELLQQQLLQKKELATIPRLKKVVPPKVCSFEPTPVLRLFMGEVMVEGEDQAHWRPWYAEPEPELEPFPLPMAELLFEYGKHRVAFADDREQLWVEEAGERLQIPRQLEKEKELEAEELPQLLFPLQLLQFDSDVAEVPQQYLDCLTINGGEENVPEFCLQDLPRLRDWGWKIEFSEEWPWHFVGEPDNWYAELDDSESEWFSLGLDVDIGGERTSLLPPLLEFVSQLPDEVTLEQLNELPDDFQLMMGLDDGRILPVPISKIRTILATLIELYDEHPLDESGRIRFSRLEAVRMAELQAAEGAAHLRWLGGERLLELGRKLRDFSGIQLVAASRQFQAELRDYQKEGLSWLQFLREMGLGGILADDMGLGKTVQTLAHLQLEKQSGRMQYPCLVIAPTSLMVNWRSEAARFAPDLKVTVLHGADRKERFDQIADSDLVLTTYPLVPRDHEVLLQQEYHQLILDEAQVIKNPKARVTQLVHQIRAQYRLCLSGTPMENHLGELWSLMHFLNPGLLGDEKQFRRQYRTPIEKRGDSYRQQLLQRKVAPFLLRRTKQQVVLELPEKSEIIRSIELDGAQRKLYESIRLAMHEKIKKEVERKGISRSHIVILDALLKLRQACCDPRLLKLDAAKKVKGSVKLEMLMQLLPEMLEEGRRILLFSQFTSMLKLIEAELKKRKIDYLKLTGQTRDRATPVERFQAGEIPLFLISLKAGGTGLNLTAADTVIHYDPWWNPAVENQATDRAHRIGQKNAVFVYKFITANTVEERILELQQRKSALVEGLYGDGKARAGGQFSAEDLQMLFDPLEP